MRSHLAGTSSSPKSLLTDFEQKINRRQRLVLQGKQNGVPSQPVFIAAARMGGRRPAQAPSLSVQRRRQARVPHPNRASPPPRQEEAIQSPAPECPALPSFHTRWASTAARPDPLHLDPMDTLAWAVQPRQGQGCPSGSAVNS